MADTPDRAPRKFAFKPKEFDCLNAPRSEAGAEPGPPPPANDVYAIRQELREREIAAGQDNLKPADRPRSTKRRRDYWLLLLLANGVLVPLAIHGVRSGNAVLAVYAFAGAVFLTVGLTWVMWFVVNRY